MPRPKSRTDTDLVDEIIRRQERLAAERGTWESHWQEIAARVLPRQDEFVRKRTGGEKRTERIYDATAALALERFAAAMESMLVPRTQRWHRLRVTDERLNQNPEVRQWFDRTTDILFAARYSTHANYASQQHETFMSLGAFGTGAMLIEGIDGKGIRYKSIHLAELFIAEDRHGRIDTAHRRFEYTARQARQAWGDRLPARIADCAETEPDRKFEFIHCVRPREDAKPGRADWRGMPWASYYVSVEGRDLLSEGGFHKFPYAISRYVTAPREVYGRSPAMIVLPDIKMLNEMSKTVIRAAHKTVDPPLLLHDDGVLGLSRGGRPNLDPGALNVGGLDDQGRAKVRPLQTGGRPDLGLELMEQRRKTINDAFLVTLFQILVDGPSMTATEVLERAREKGILLAPTMGRQQSEALGPMIERELDILARVPGALPPLPDALKRAGGAYEIEYDSPLNRAQRAEDGAAIQRVLEGVGPLAAMDPSVLDAFDKDAIVRILAEVNGVPEKVLHSEEAVAALRQQRQQAQAMQQMAALAPPAARAIKDVSEAQAAARRVQ
ncbi:MAG TPA: portal protein [Alphaproteobacteria bacterium]|nr:portal protein [Alphaproteobacteria bacterium]